MPELDEEGRWTASEASLFLGFHETRGRAAMIEKHVRDENERQARPRWVPTQRFSPVKAPPQPVSAWAPAPPTRAEIAAAAARPRRRPDAPTRRPQSTGAVEASRFSLSGGGDGDGSVLRFSMGRSARSTTARGRSRSAMRQTSVAPLGGAECVYSKQHAFCPDCAKCRHLRRLRLAAVAAADTSNQAVVCVGTDTYMWPP